MDANCTTAAGFSFLVQM